MGSNGRAAHDRELLIVTVTEVAGTRGQLTPERIFAVTKRPCDAPCLSVVSFNCTKCRAQSSSISYTLALDLPLHKLNYVLFSSAYSLVRGYAS